MPMKVSELWLREWVNPKLTASELAAQLTMAGLEVDALNPVAGQFNNVVVAKVLKTAPHPQADRLTLCEVDAGKGTPLKIVCGASNVRPDLNVALALPGAHLPGDIHIKESTLRGELSQGMLCSVVELGLEESSDGIMELADDAPVGNDLRDYLQLNDYILDIDLTPNRADCFSILGVAREVAALNKLATPSTPSTVNPPVIDEVLPITLNAAQACPKYCGRVIREINPDATTPLWMKERLRRSGIRSLHPVVDVTNYVMLELGQPMHAFDLQRIEGSIDVRYGQNDETLILLDGQEITLSPDVLVIADQKQPLAIAGVMGGEESSVQATTTAIFLESAFFNPIVVAGVARRYGLFSDSSQRFERGVDPNLQTIALERATELLQEIVGGKAGPVIVVSKEEHLPTKATINFNPAKVKQLTGIDISDNDMLTILRDLGMSVEQQKNQWAVDVPSHRFDLALDVDLVEEIVRLHGYDNIESQPSLTSMQAGTTNSFEQLANKAAHFFSHQGYAETINYSFVDPELQDVLYPDAKTMQLLNPISSELSQMRVGLWPGLLAAMVYNAHRQQTAIKFFENGVVFDVNDESLLERHCIAGLLSGTQGDLNWSETTRPFDFYDLKGDLEALFTVLHLPKASVNFVAAEHSALHPGQSAKILINDVAAGWIGVLHPRLADALDLSTEVVLFELSLEPLLNPNVPRYKQISKYPQIRRDLSLIADIKVTAAQIEGAVREVVDAKLLKRVDIFDVYTGETIPAGKKSLAIALTLQDDRRTLVDNEINTLISAIMKKLDDAFAIILRAEA
jgi:phenylalanyl-tRNA synthetase beta chain